MNWFIRICAYVFFIANYFNFCSDAGDFSTYRGPHIKSVQDRCFLKGMDNFYTMWKY